jgi:poly-gamma-glutamate synthesis protein (capsule biosynthesis protein)
VTALLAPPRVAFAGRAGPISDATRALMTNRSWRDDPRCPAFDELALVEIDHVAMDGTSARGELVVAARIADATLALFARLHAIGFPIAGARLVDHFEAASDDASMAADNTSGFNFRVVAGTDQLSQHARGLAIDINPVENPWLTDARLVPPAGEPYRDRRAIRPGMIVRPGPVTAIFDELGWEWGGDWRHARDYHHVVYTK